MGIHRHGGLSVEDGQDDVGCLATYARDVEQVVHIVRDVASEALGERLGHSG